MRTLLAFVLLATLQFIPGVGVGEARAACTGGPSSWSDVGTWVCTYRDEAYQKLVGYNSGYASHTTPPRSWTISLVTSGYGTGRYAYRLSGLSDGYGAPAVAASFLSATQCPTGKTWNDTLKICFGAAECLARNADLGSLANLPRPSLTTSRCVANCEFGMDTTDTSTFSVTTASTGEKVYRGVMEYTGNPCSVTPTSPAGTVDEQKSMPPQECIPVSGQSMCVKADGKFCASASNGKQFCWNSRETGEKVSENQLQKRNVGNTALTPQTQPPEGESLQAQGTPLTSTVTTGGDTVTTTTTNYTTTGGTSAAPDQPDQGEPDDGTGSSGGSGSSGDTQYPAGGTDGTTGSDPGDTAIWHPAGGDGALGMLNGDGWLPRTTCPVLPSFDLGPLGVINPDIPKWCDLVQAIGLLVMFVAGIAAVRILMD